MGVFNAVLVAVLAIVLLQNGSDYVVKNFRIPPPPKLEGPLAVNKLLTKAEHLFKGIVNGPEGLEYHNGALYVTNIDAVLKIVKDKIVKTVKIPTNECEEEHCSRPLGLRHFKDEKFLIADAYKGIIEVDMAAGTVETLLPADYTLHGQRINFADDLDFIDEDTIAFSDASTNRDMFTFFFSAIELRGDGRLISFNLKTREVKLLLEGLQFANGVQLHPDKQSVLVCETHASRVTRFYFAGPKKNLRETFVRSLPLFPDNIRLTPRGTFFIAGAAPRIPGRFNLVDTLAPYPSVRRLIALLTPSSLSFSGYIATMSDYGIFVEVDVNGAFLRSFHDPSGRTKMISHVTETDNAIYIGSYAHDFLAKIDK